jgi:beta-glucanase (GH16 family)
MKMPSRYFTLLSFFIFFFAPLSSQASPPSAAYGSPVLDHDFGTSRNIKNSSDLERNYDWGYFWGPSNPNNPFANFAEWQRYTPLTSNNYLFTPNTLKLIARFNRNNGDNQISKGEITSGSIRSKRKFKPTATKSFYFEVRMKVPKGKGLWPAFWLYRHGGGGEAEIDIVEIVNNKWDSSKAPDWKPLAYHNNLHYRSGIDKKPDSPYGSVKRRTPLGSDYHIWGGEWTAKGVSFYLDGKHIRTEPYPLNNASVGWGGSNPADIIINLAAGGGWPGSAEDKAAYPATLEVDYLRVYEKSGSKSSGGGNADNIASVSGPANVKPGQRVTVTIKYKAKTPRTIVAGFQLARKPWTTYKGATASKNVGAGSGTANLTFTIPKNATLGENYQYQSYITETNKGWNERKYSKEQAPITVVKEVGNNNGSADNIIWASGPANVKRGQRVTINVKYKASTPRKIVSLFQLAKYPWTTYTGATASSNVATGKGFVSLTFTIPNNVPLGANYQYQNYITEMNRGWYERKSFKEQAPITVLNNSHHSDSIIWASGPTNVKRGQRITVKVKYKASAPRKIVSLFQLAQKPWTTYRGATASTNVKAGKGIAYLTFTIPKHIPLGRRYQYQHYITEHNRGWYKRKDSKENGTVNLAR